MGRLKGHSEHATEFLKRLAEAVSGIKPEARGKEIIEKESGKS
jgi:hypothetical protein